MISCRQLIIVNLLHKYFMNMYWIILNQEFAANKKVIDIQQSHTINFLSPVSNTMSCGTKWFALMLNVSFFKLHIAACRTSNRLSRLTSVYRGRTSYISLAMSQKAPINIIWEALILWTLKPVWVYMSVLWYYLIYLKVSDYSTLRWG